MLQKQHVKAIGYKTELDIKHSHVVVLWTSSFVIYLSEYKSYLSGDKNIFLLSHIYYYLLYLYKSHLVNLVRFFFLNQIMKTNSVIILLYVCTM